jgi:NitT/TauT family transport system substrate-binding protein
MRVRLFQPFRVVFYAPIEVAQRGGFLATEGLDLDVTITGSTPRYLDALSRGEADIAMGGPMRTMKWAEEGHRADVVNFAEVNSRSGFFLLSRTPQPNFQPTALVGKEVITFAEAPTPWFCLQAVLRRYGVDPAQVHWLPDLPTPVAVETFLSGRADYLLQTEPVVERLVQDGTAFLCMAQAEACGHLAFTSYITATATLYTQPELIERFTRAVYRTQQWMAHHSAAEIAQTIQASFPDIPVDMLGAAIERFQHLATWPADPVLRREGFENLAEVLRLAGYLIVSPSYDALVDTSIARRVVQAG